MCYQCEELEPCPTDECDGGCEAFGCVGCEINTLHIDEYYMVHDEIWKTVRPEGSGMLCIGCVEDRLGRQLTASDFTDAPVNDGPMIFKSKRLAARLAAH